MSGSKPYRFTAEQLALLDAHFGEREVWLPMTLDDLVAALVEAQTRRLTCQHESALVVTFVKLSERATRRRRLQCPHQHPHRSRAQSARAQRPARRGGQEGVPGVELTQKKSYIRAHLGRITVGYLYPSPNGGRSAVETPLPTGAASTRTRPSRPRPS